MASSDDDEELKRAIAMSLAEMQPTPTPAKDVDLVSSDDDDDLRQAIALSLQQSESALNSSQTSNPAIGPGVSRGSGYATTSQECRTPTQVQLDAAPKKSNGIFGFDRKAMEQERLARLGKRKRTASLERPSKMATRPLSSKAATNPGESQESPDLSSLQYPEGTIKRTWAHKHPRTNDIKIEEVLQPSTLSIAVLSAFQWDDRWLFSKIDTRKTKQIWVMSAKGKDLQDKLLAEAAEAKIPNFKTHFPPMPGQVVNMHSKLMLLFHPTHLRIVIPTANMIKVDWGETERDPRTGESWQPAVMENTVFMIDLPRRSDGGARNEKSLPSFGRELLYFLEAQELGQKVTEGVLKFDFAETAHFEFVHAIGGSHQGQNAARTGLPGLSGAIRRMGLDQVQKLEIDCTTSSLGGLKESFLKQLYTAASGKPLSTQGEVPATFLDHIRIYFPSRETVVKSTGGVACGGIITLNRSHYNESFPKQCMREYKSTRGGVLSHNKILLVRGLRKDNTAFAWAYVGSANLTESAWGSQKVLKSGSLGVLGVRNWECGVVVPVPEEKMEGLEPGDVPPMSVFEGTIEVPFQYPGERFDGKEPWFFREE